MNTQAINRVAPAALDTLSTNPSYINRAFRTPCAVDGSASWTIPGAGPGMPPCWVTITNISLTATDLMTVVFGRSSEGVLGNAETAEDFVILPGSTQDFYCESGVDTAKFGGPVTAIASHYRSCL